MTPTSSTLRAFATKPRTATQEFEDLKRILTSQDLAFVLGRAPETVSRLRSRDSFHRSLERLIDNVWWVLHVALAEWKDPAEARFFLISRHPALEGRTPADAIREGDVETVVQLVRASPVKRSDATLTGRAADDRRREARERFLERSRTLSGIDLDALADIHEHGWSSG